MTSTSGRVVPWADWAEWRDVGRWLFSREPAECARGVARVAAWRVRGRLPLGADATAQLRAAQLADAGFAEEPSEEAEERRSDERGKREEDKGIDRKRALFPPDSCAPSVWTTESSLRCRFSVTLARLVSGVADQTQRGRVAASVASLAGRAGLPRSLVDVRHASAHGELPSLPELRVAARDALEWLRDCYWNAQSAKVWGADATPAAGGESRRASGQVAGAENAWPLEPRSSGEPIFSRSPALLPGTGGEAVAAAVARLARLLVAEARRGRGASAPRAGETAAAGDGSGGGGVRGGESGGNENQSTAHDAGTHPSRISKRERNRFKALKKEASAELARAFEGPASDRVVAAAALQGMARVFGAADRGDEDDANEGEEDGRERSRTPDARPDDASRSDDGLSAVAAFQAMQASAPPPLLLARSVASHAAPLSSLPATFAPSNLSFLLDALTSSLLRIAALVAEDRPTLLPLAAEESVRLLRAAAEALGTRQKATRDASVSEPFVARVAAAAAALAAAAAATAPGEGGETAEVPGTTGETAEPGSAVGRGTKGGRGTGGSDAAKGVAHVGSPSESPSAALASTFDRDTLCSPSAPWRVALAATTRKSRRELVGDDVLVSTEISAATRVVVAWLDAFASAMEPNRPTGVTKRPKVGGGAPRSVAVGALVPGDKSRGNGSRVDASSALDASVVSKRRKVETPSVEASAAGEGASSDVRDPLAARLAALERLVGSPCASASDSDADSEAESETSDGSSRDDEGPHERSLASSPAPSTGSLPSPASALERSTRDASRPARWRPAAAWRPAALGRLPDAVDPAGRLPDLDAPLPWRLVR